MGVLYTIKEIMDEYEEKIQEAKKFPEFIKEELINELKKSYINKVENLLVKK